MEKTVCGYCRAIDGARVVFFEDGEADCDYPRCAHAAVCDIAAQLAESEGQTEEKI